jgi:hypothetical protein
VSDALGPDEIRDALTRLRSAGESLRARPHAALDALATLLERLRDADAPERRRLEAELPGATGFSPETVRIGLETALAPWTGEALRNLAHAQPGTTIPAPFVAGVILAGALPPPSVISIAAPLLAGAPVLVKPSAHDALTPALVAQMLRAIDPEVGSCVELAPFHRDDAACTAAFCEADVLELNGSDEAVAHLTAQVHPPRRALRHGHRLSVAIVGREANSDLAERLALDVALWDQLGCLSAVAIYAVGGFDPTHALADALARSETRMPRGRVELEANAASARERDAAAMRGAEVHVASDAAWTVVCEGDAAPRPAPLFRFVRVHPVADAAAALDALAPIGAHLQGVALEGIGRDERDLAGELRVLGASRVCRPGALQAPPLDWPRDGLPTLDAWRQPA